MGQKQKTEKKKKERERAKVGDNNGQARMAHASQKNTLKSLLFSNIKGQNSSSFGGNFRTPMVESIDEKTINVFFNPYQI